MIKKLNHSNYLIEFGVLAKCGPRISMIWDIETWMILKEIKRNC